MGLVENLEKSYGQGSGLRKSCCAVIEEKIGRKAEGDRKDSEIVISLGQKRIFSRNLRRIGCKSGVQSCVKSFKTSGNIKSGHKGAVERPIKK